MKMKTVYEANPALGDPMSIQVKIFGLFLCPCLMAYLLQGQLTENGHRLDKLRSDLRRYQVWSGEDLRLCNRFIDKPRDGWKRQRGELLEVRQVH